MDRSVQRWCILKNEETVFEIGAFVCEKERGEREREKDKKRSLHQRLSISLGFVSVRFI